MTEQKILQLVIVGAVFTGAACSGYDTDRMWGERMVTVTGCVQAVPAANSFVLANVGAKQGARPQARQTYVLEGATDLADKVGKQVRVRGQLTATLETADSSPARRDPLTLDELGRLRVQTLETLDGTCGASFEGVSE